MVDVGPDPDGRAERRLRTRISTICGVVAFASAIVLTDPFRWWSAAPRADPLIVLILFLAAAAFLGLASFDVLRAIFLR